MVRSSTLQRKSLYCPPIKLWLPSMGGTYINNFISYMDICCCEECAFQAVQSGIGCRNQKVLVKSRVSSVEKLCGSRKYPHPTTEAHWKFQGGGGLKGQGMYEPKLEFPEGWGSNQKNSLWGEYGINNSFVYSLW